MPDALSAFIAIFASGLLLRWAVLSKAHAERLASFVFSISLPATIMVSLDRVAFTADAWTLPLAACLITVPVTGCALVIARRLRLARPAQGGFALGAGCINSIYFAYPVTQATFGEAGLARAILFDLGQTMLTLTALYGMAVWHGTRAASPARAIRRFLSSPPLWALGLLLAMKLFGLHLPAWARAALLPIHFTTTPLASLVLGLSIDLAALRRSAALALLGAAVRMAGGLLFGSLAAWLLGLSGLERAVVILIAGMPSAVTAVIFAAEAGLDEDLVASIVALSICLGVALLPWVPPLAARLAG